MADIESGNEQKKATRSAHDRVDTRRRAVTTAAAGLPVVLALRHRSVRAAWQCDSPSGFTSLNVSGHARPFSCEGRSPGYYKTHSTWPSLTPDTLFYAVFLFVPGAPHFKVPDARALTMQDVLEFKGNEDPRQMGAYFVAAILNAEGGLTDPISPALVKEMWAQFATRGSYSPPPGADEWFAEDIKYYFETTWA